MDNPDTIYEIKSKKSELLDKNSSEIYFPLKFSALSGKLGLCPEEFCFNRELTTKFFEGFVTNGNYINSPENIYTISSFNCLFEAQ